MKPTEEHYVTFLFMFIDYNYVLEMYMYLYSDSKQISATATGFFNATVHNIKKSIANKD